MSGLEQEIARIVDERLSERLGPTIDWGTIAAVAAEVGMTEQALRTRVERGWLPHSDVSREGRRVYLRRSGVARRIERSSG